MLRVNTYGTIANNVQGTLIYVYTEKMAGISLIMEIVVIL